MIDFRDFFACTVLCEKADITGVGLTAHLFPLIASFIRRRESHFSERQDTFSILKIFFPFSDPVSVNDMGQCIEFRGQVCEFLLPKQKPESLSVKIRPEKCEHFLPI